MKWITKQTLPRSSYGMARWLLGLALAVDLALMTELDAELLQVSLAAIHVHSDGSLRIKLKNNQVIERR